MPEKANVLEEKPATASSIWRHIFPPVIVVTTIWFTMSAATTYYLHWLDQSYRLVFSENVASIHAADALESVTWKLISAWPADEAQIGEFRAHCETSKTDLELLLRKLRETAQAEIEVQLVERLATMLADLTSSIDSAAMTGFATDTKAWQTERALVREHVLRVVSIAAELRGINESLIENAAKRRDGVRRAVLVTRIAMLVTGLILGIYLGWRMARRLQQSVARIAITLGDVTSSDSRQIGSISLRADGPLGDVQQQAERVVEKLRQADRELRSARSEVIRSERLAAVGELAAGVAHELRNPLTSVKLLLQHAVKQANNAPPSGGKLQLIFDEIDRMEATIQGLLDFSRPRSLNRVHQDLRETLQRAINLVDGRVRQQRVALEVRLGDRPLWIEADSEHLCQVFVNLILNAVEALPHEGRLAIEAQSLAAENGEAGPRIRVLFRDNGPGISPDVLSRLFEPFATTKERGTGLGLAVSRRIVEEHGGLIRAENRPAGGAEFTVELPGSRQVSRPLLLERVT